jgi:2-dehydropantoate 2-reductase
VIGELAGGASARVEALRGALARCKGPSIEVSDDIRCALWQKFMFITSWCSVGAVTRAPAGIVRRLPETRQLIEGSLLEMERVARRGVKCGSRRMSSPPPCAFWMVCPRTARLHDLTGAVVRWGARLGIDTPVNRMLYGALLPLEQKARGELSF